MEHPEERVFFVVWAEVNRAILFFLTRSEGSGKCLNCLPYATVESVDRATAAKKAFWKFIQDQFVLDSSEWIQSFRTVGCGENVSQCLFVSVRRRIEPPAYSNEFVWMTGPMMRSHLSRHENDASLLEIFDAPTLQVLRTLHGAGLIPAA
jgi:hypothetical protein